MQRLCGGARVELGCELARAWAAAHRCQGAAVMAAASRHLRSGPRATFARFQRRSSPRRTGGRGTYRRRMLRLCEKDAAANGAAPARLQLCNISTLYWSARKGDFCRKPGLDRILPYKPNPDAHKHTHRLMNASRILRAAPNCSAPPQMRRKRLLSALPRQIVVFTEDAQQTYVPSPRFGVHRSIGLVKLLSLAENP